MTSQDTLSQFLKPTLQPLVFFNTETRKKELLRVPLDKHLRIYTCGPTVYNYAHIGNFRTYVFEDLLRRTLKFSGFKVTQVMNLTDIDDKTIRGAIETNLPLVEFTKPFIEAFFTDIQTLGIERVEHYPAATEYIAQMILFIQDLLDKKVAYRGKDGCIYYSIARYPRYGRLSHLKLEELKVGAGESQERRLAMDEYDKENAGDFVLWKGYDPTRDGKVFWESPFGPGRPGWHLECSTMAMSILGETIDIHVGAVDNIFPHHENEIAQSEARSDKLFVHLWLHSEHLLVNHKKMSKSLGNFYTLRDLLSKGYSGREVRYMLLQTHYRTQLNFTFEGLEGARTALQRLQDFVGRMQERAEAGALPTPEVLSLLTKTYQDFSQALADDLNISEALASLFECMKSINVLEEHSLTAGDAQGVLYLLQQLNQVLNIFVFETENHPPEILALLEQRNAARGAKEWQRADQLRQQLSQNGYEIEDTPRGPRLKKLN